MNFSSAMDKSIFSVSNRSVVPVLSIIAKEVYKLLFFIAIKKADYNIEQLLAIWLGLQVIFSIIFGRISDKYCRKKTLCLTLGCSIVSIILLNHNFFLIAILFDGIFCNITPIARAAYCDVHITQGRMPNIVNTFIAQAIPWIVLAFNYKIFHAYIYYIAFVFAIFIFIMALLFFRDFRDKKDRKKGIAFSEIKIKFFHWNFLRLTIAMLIWNSMWHLILYFSEENLQEINLQKYFFLIVGVAFFTGAILTRIFKFKANQVIPLVFLFTLLFFFFDWVLSMLLKLPSIISPYLFLQYTILGGIGLPLIYSYFGEKASVHEQGVVYGFLESIQSTSEFIGPFLLGFILSIKDIHYLIVIPFLVISYFLSIKLSNKNKKQT